MKTRNFFFLLFVLFGIIFSGGFSSSNDVTQINDNQEFTVTTHETLRNCSKVEDCQHSYAKCIHNQCQCPTRLDKKCYGNVNDGCIDSSDCVGIQLVCQNNKCVLSNETTEGKNLCNYKLGASVCWGPERSRQFSEIYCTVWSKGCLFNYWWANKKEPEAERRVSNE
ncbi:hypothetical protein KQX54_014954 [Cotesia glomerata]|uniref:Uncharacterized protein n=1 Tax=Cotesia glomerata TaxID=32391 RepID=A0AAV7IUC8_COTGL|nr:hypothetical protein KQX54_014954 [Cotesia glomerata]